MSRKRHSFNIQAAALALLAAGGMHTAGAVPVSLTGVNDVYTQNFDSLRATGTSATWIAGTTLTGWYATNISAPISSIGVNNGGTSAGALPVGVSSVGVAGSTERALGLASIPPAPGQSNQVITYLAVTNNTSSALGSFTLRYDVEQWRNGGSGLSDRLVFGYKLGNSTFSAAGFTNQSSLDGISPVDGLTAGGTPELLDGNADANRRAGAGGTVTLDWAVGQTLWLRWRDTAVGTNGADNMLAIDNLELSVALPGGGPVSAVPEPTTTALLLAGLGALAWVRRARLSAPANARPA